MKKLQIGTLICNVIALILSLVNLVVGKWGFFFIITILTLIYFGAHSAYGIYGIISKKKKICDTIQWMYAAWVITYGVWAVLAFIFLQVISGVIFLIYVGFGALGFYLSRNMVRAWELPI